MGVHFKSIVDIRWQSILILGFRFIVIRHQHLQMSLSGVAGCKTSCRLTLAFTFCTGISSVPWKLVYNVYI